MKNISIPLSLSLSKKYKKTEYSDDEILAGILGFIGSQERLNEPCLEIIDLRFDLIEREPNEQTKPTACRTFDEIAGLLNLTAANARQRFKRCFDKLREFVINEPELKEYIRL